MATANRVSDRGLPMLPPEFGATRDYVHDVSKVLGKLQQSFVKSAPHYWHVGLRVVPGGLATQPMSVGGAVLVAEIDLALGEIRLGAERWPLADYSGPRLLQAVQTWAQAAGLVEAIEMPAFAPEPPAYNAAAAGTLGHLLTWAGERLETVAATYPRDMASPVLLYPHHFDISAVRFFEPAAAAPDEARQLGLGFSLGDDMIAEPYYYATLYPGAEQLNTVALPPGAEWVTAGFTGLVLRYSALQQVAHPDRVVEAFGQAAIARALESDPQKA